MERKLEYKVVTPAGVLPQCPRCRALLLPRHMEAGSAKYRCPCGARVEVRREA